MNGEVRKRKKEGEGGRRNTARREEGLTVSWLFFSEVIVEPYNV